jgi:hypothetical protein
MIKGLGKIALGLICFAGGMDWVVRGMEDMTRKKTESETWQDAQSESPLVESGPPNETVT